VSAGRPPAQRPKGGGQAAVNQDQGQRHAAQVVRERIDLEGDAADALRSGQHADDGEHHQYGMPSRAANLLEAQPICSNNPPMTMAGFTDPMA
jgi:hypothetical protein